MGRKKTSRTHSVSGGENHKVRARRAKRRLLIKINRWENSYRLDQLTVERGDHRGLGNGPWSTEGMRRHLRHLDKVITSPPKRP